MKNRKHRINNEIIMDVFAGIILLIMFKISKTHRDAVMCCVMVWLGWVIAGILRICGRVLLSKIIEKRKEEGNYV